VRDDQLISFVPSFATQHTETLKLVFVLYFRILKNPNPTPLLSAALRGIARYAHLVNIDFFKDLMKVLKDLISREPDSDSDSDEVVPHESGGDVRYRLECIVTAFELLTGQGAYLATVRVSSVHPGAA
jgi:nucleolar complex protein 3